MKLSEINSFISKYGYKVVYVEPKYFYLVDIFAKDEIFARVRPKLRLVTNNSGRLIVFVDVSHFTETPDKTTLDMYIKTMSNAREVMDYLNSGAFGGIIDPETIEVDIPSEGSKIDIFQAVASLEHPVIKYWGYEEWELDDGNYMNLEFRVFRNGATDSYNMLFPSNDFYQRFEFDALHSDDLEGRSMSLEDFSAILKYYDSVTDDPDDNEYLEGSVIASAITSSILTDKMKGGNNGKTNSSK